MKKLLNYFLLAFGLNASMPENIKNILEGCSLEITTKVSGSGYYKPQGGEATGFVCKYKDQIYVITNAHVMHEMQMGDTEGYSINGKQYDIALLATHPLSDISVGKIKNLKNTENAEEIKPFLINENDEIKYVLGETLYMASNPGGKGLSFFSGTISDPYAINWEGGTHNFGREGFVVTSINSKGGSSGSLALDAKGRLAGVLKTGSNTSANLVPASSVMWFLGKIYREEKTFYHPGFLTGLENVGILEKHYGYQNTQNLSKSDPAYKNRLLRIACTLPGMLSETDLEAGDVIEYVDKKPVGANQALFNQLCDNPEITLSIDRKGEKKEIKVKTTDISQHRPKTFVKIGDVVFAPTSFEKHLRTGIGLERVLVTYLASGCIFSKAPNEEITGSEDLTLLEIMQIGGKKINDLQDLKKAFEGIDKHSNVTFKNHATRFRDSISIRNSFEVSMPFTFDSNVHSEKLEFVFNPETGSWTKTVLE